MLEYKSIPIEMWNSHTYGSLAYGKRTPQSELSWGHFIILAEMGKLRVLTQTCKSMV